MNYPEPRPRWLMKSAIGRPGIYWLPNAITTCALFAGFYAIVQAMNLRFELAAMGIFVAMVFDATPSLRQQNRTHHTVEPAVTAQHDILPT